MGPLRVLTDMVSPSAKQMLFAYFSSRRYPGRSYAGTRRGLSRAALAWRKNIPSHRSRRGCTTSPHLRGSDYDDLAQQSADDALVAILRKLGDFRGDSRFTTWAYKFALYEAAANVRKRAWQGREIPLKAETWPLIVDDHQRTAQESVETTDTLAALREAIESELSPHQREVLVALALNEV